MFKSIFKHMKKTTTYYIYTHIYMFKTFLKNTQETHIQYIHGRVTKENKQGVNWKINK